MFPIADDNTGRRITPIVNYVFIGINILVFVLLQGLGGNDAFTYSYSLVPKEVMTGTDLVGQVPVMDAMGRVLGAIPLGQTSPSVYVTFLTSMFMHGDIMHIFGNMLFMWVFGDNLENRIGHIRYAIFYILCGFAAAFGQIFMDTNSVIPMLGASGAISGILGGYLLLYPRNRVQAIVLNMAHVNIPAYVALGIWILYQIVLGFLSPTGGGGVAYAAHIGGFIAGLALIKLFAWGTSDDVPAAQV